MGFLFFVHGIGGATDNPGSSIFSARTASGLRWPKIGVDGRWQGWVYIAFCAFCLCFHKNDVRPQVPATENLEPSASCVDAWQFRDERYTSRPTQADLSLLFSSQCYCPRARWFLPAFSTVKNDKRSARCQRVQVLGTKREVLEFLVPIESSTNRLLKRFHASSWLCPSPTASHSLARSFATGPIRWKWASRILHMCTRICITASVFEDVKEEIFCLTRMCREHTPSCGCYCCSKLPRPVPFANTRVQMTCANDQDAPELTMSSTESVTLYRHHDGIIQIKPGRFTEICN